MLPGMRAVPLPTSPPPQLFPEVLGTEAKEGASASSGALPVPWPFDSVYPAGGHFCLSLEAVPRRLGRGQQTWSCRRGQGGADPLWRLRQACRDCQPSDMFQMGPKALTAQWGGGSGVTSSRSLNREAAWPGTELLAAGPVKTVCFHISCCFSAKTEQLHLGPGRRGVPS